MASLAKFAWIPLILVLISISCDAYKILIYFPLPGKSHSILGEGIANLLVKAGHEVTYVTPFVPKKTQANLRVIDVSSTAALMDSNEKMLNIESILKKESDMDISVMVNMMLELNVMTFETEQFKTFIENPNEHFDLVLVEWMFLEFSSGLSMVLNAPYIWISTCEPHWMVLRLIDEALNPAYNADIMSSSVVPYTFTQRLSELAFQAMGYGFKEIYYGGTEAKTYEKVFKPLAEKRGVHYQPLDVVKYNASLILGNSHVSMGEATRLPQNYKPVGGYHIEERVHPLPDDLKKIMENAKHGVIYFSMGSNLKSKDWPQEIKINLLKMFGELKQTVLWKFEEALPNLPPNVHVVQWAPQPSILLHPNCVLFITHGGLLSTTEAIHFGVPVVGIPVFGDQFVNVKRMVKKGMGLEVEFSYSLVDNLKVAVGKVLADDKYRKKVKELSVIYHDRVATPARELVHWAEHVVRTRGAPHLRSPAMMVPWYQKLYLDLIALVLVVLCVLKKILKKIFCSKKKANKLKTN